jgi:hypothetical protein
VVRHATLTLGIAIFSSVAISAETPAKHAEQVAVAERDGRRLFEALRSPTSPLDPRVAHARSKISDFCELPYVPVIVGTGNNTSVYFLADVPRGQGVPIGRHYRVSGNAVTPSTRSCLVTPPVPQEAVAQFVTHTLTEVPSEFHVYLSLMTGKVLLVGTPSGTWSVANGRVRFEQPP